MFKVYFILLLLAHILGDFYAQTSNMAKQKENSMKWVLVHCLCYWLTTVLILLPIMSWKMFWIGTVSSVLHTLIDILKYWHVSKLRKNNIMTLIKDRNIFFMDQLLHLICLVGISYLVVLENIPIYVCRTLTQFFNTIGISERGLVSWGGSIINNT